jgi:hypothetical protein
MYSKTLKSYDRDGILVLQSGQEAFRKYDTTHGVMVSFAQTPEGRHLGSSEYLLVLLRKFWISK